MPSRHVRAATLFICPQWLLRRGMVGCDRCARELHVRRGSVGRAQLVSLDTWCRLVAWIRNAADGVLLQALSLCRQAGVHGLVGYRWLCAQCKETSCPKRNWRVMTSGYF